jgi:5-histidylcysteine sulfoxide synthase
MQNMTAVADLLFSPRYSPQMDTRTELTRNPNLTLSAEKLDVANETLVQERFKRAGLTWWTGLAPNNCPGFRPETGRLHALPLLNLKVATRADALAAFQNSWALTEVLFQALRTDRAFNTPAYHRLRHPLIFYYGHPAVLYVNKMRLAGLINEPIDTDLERILETGVDEMSWDDMSKNDMEWPSVERIHAYRRRVYETIVDVLSTHKGLETDAPPSSRMEQSDLWAVWMGIEHEKIHLETSSMLMRELPVTWLSEPEFFPTSNASTHGEAGPPAQRHQPVEWQNHPGGAIRFGKPLGTPSFGWDNEYGERSVSLKPFSLSKTQITNAQFYDFVVSGGYQNDSLWSEEGLRWRRFRNTKRPAFWVAEGPEGSHQYRLRTIFQIVKMPWDWPVEVCFHEAQAYCAWLNQKSDSLHHRLITEAEFRSLLPAEDPVLQSKPNELTARDSSPGLAPSRPRPKGLNLESGSPHPADEALMGNVWTWAEDHFNPLPGFKTHSLYDDFSTPCFDGRHQMILGGSFISCGHEASRWARFHFRPHFFQHAGFRVARTLDGSKDNQAVRLGQNTVKPQRTESLLEQMNGPSWWSSIEQPLRMSSGDLQSLYRQASDSLLEFERGFQSQSPMGTAHDPRRNTIPKDFRLPYEPEKKLPQTGEPDFQKLLDLVLKKLAPLSQNPGHPGYAAYVAGSSNPVSAIGQWISMTLNAFSGHFMMAPGMVAIEAETIQWFIDMVGLPAGRAGGYLTTGTSLASVGALALARERAGLHGDLSKATLYVSQQGHHCIAKAWRLLGFRDDRIRFIEADATRRLKAEPLRKSVQADQASGLLPLVIVGTAGSTNTGAVDPLSEIAEIAHQNKVWYHVDGAYGAPFLLTRHGRSLLKGIEQADSVCFDLHKAFCLPYGTGCLLVGDKGHLRLNAAGSRSYMPPEIDPSLSPLWVDYADLTPELSRDSRGLRVWLPLKYFGIEPFALNLEEKLELSQWFAGEIEKIQGLKVVAQPQLTIFAFRGPSQEFSRELMARINESGTLFLSSCTLDETFTIRVCLLSHRLDHSRLRRAVIEIRHLCETLQRQGFR